MSAQKPILITQGDPSGIGLELTLQIWRDRRELELPPFALVADPAHVARLAHTFRWDIPVRFATAETATSLFCDALPVIPLSTTVNAIPGHPTPEAAPAILESIETSVSLALEDRVAAIVTNPVAKYVLPEDDYPHRGSGEFIASLVEKHLGQPTRPVLMLWSDLLAVVPVTTDIPLTDVALCLTSDLIVSTASVVAADLTRRFGIERPRLAVTGLNPHAGDSGSLGTEDRDIIAPAITLLRRREIDARGPYSADSLFHERARAGYDAVITMYHDQAMIPIKTLALDSAVNVTLGLPLIRTAPSHGTAFDIAGRGIGNPISIISAVRLAGRLAEASRTT